ncbi:uncharacterized protein EI97DRAFT_203345 [Westerdykella ornata]|uniref:Uncharacterized protein n=1 Tax=Westerdykella ornata TaxID=318751 RepID=A0A6A6J8E4_WESOR|nr:uncharacterized protein EI97DRAFT_203345 [Westerdykella ornata]KAF2272692.1 hypothetical protein EI97DRAFT_203345 [Westerdykella ornata]
MSTFTRPHRPDIPSEFRSFAYKRCGLWDLRILERYAVRLSTYLLTMEYATPTALFNFFDSCSFLFSEREGSARFTLLLLLFHTFFSLLLFSVSLLVYILLYSRERGFSLLFLPLFNFLDLRDPSKQAYYCITQ